MEKPSKEGEGAEETVTCTEKDQRDAEVLSGNMSRKQKRKALKKLKRKQIRKEVAVKEREQEEARLNDPEEQRKIQLIEQEEAERIERERKEFEERERAWIEAMEMKKKKEAEEAEEEEKRKLLDESRKQQEDKENKLNEDDEWEYVEEGPPEIIWQGNEIIFKKKKVRVPKKNSGHQNEIEDGGRPTSNPLPPDSEIISDYTNSSVASAQQVLDNVAQQVPNFGTEQDKAHCPFHLKTGACRFGQRCSRVHFYPDKSCTLLMKNMYNGPGLAWEQDEGLEYTDEEVERSYEVFYEDVHTEFLKFGEIVNFKVCRNGSFHLRGNVYVQYKSLESALLAFNSINGRYFAAKQIRCEFVNLTRWKVAICGEYMKSGFKTCSHGSACNFIHCFRNPGGDYEWADFDKPPPNYWVIKMAALFGYSDDYEKLTERESYGVLKSSSKKKTDSERYRSRRSRSREMKGVISGCLGRRKSEDERKRRRTGDEEICEQNTKLKDNHKRKGRTFNTDSDREWLEKEGDGEKRPKYCRERSFNRNKDDKSRCYEEYSDVDWVNQKTREKEHHTEGRSSRQRNKDSKDWIYEAGSDGECSDKDRDMERHRMHKWKSSRHWNKDGDDCICGAGSDENWSDRDRDSQRPRIPKKKSSRCQNRNSEDCIYEGGSDGDWSDRDGDRERHHHHKSQKSRHQISRNNNLTSEAESYEGLFYGDGDMETQHDCSSKSSRHKRGGFQGDYRNYEDESDEDDGHCSRWERHRQALYHHARKSGKHHKRSENFDGQEERT